MSPRAIARWSATVVGPRGSTRARRNSSRFSALSIDLATIHANSSLLCHDEATSRYRRWIDSRSPRNVPVSGGACAVTLSATAANTKPSALPKCRYSVVFATPERRATASAVTAATPSVATISSAASRRRRSGLCYVVAPYRSSM